MANVSLHQDRHGCPLGLMLASQRVSRGPGHALVHPPRLQQEARLADDVCPSQCPVEQGFGVRREFVYGTLDSPLPKGKNS